MFQIFVEPPRVELLPLAQETKSSQTSVLKCRVSGHPRPRIIWMKNGERINQRGRIVVSNMSLFDRHYIFYWCFSKHRPCLSGIKVFSLVFAQNILIFKCGFNMHLSVNVKMGLLMCQIYVFWNWMSHILFFHSFKIIDMYLNTRIHLGTFRGV